MKCTHPVEHLIGTADGIKCRVCGQLFPSYADLVKDRGADEKTKKEAKQEVAETTEAPTDEAPTDEAPKKKTTKKGAK